MEKSYLGSGERLFRGRNRISLHDHVKHPSNSDAMHRADRFINRARDKVESGGFFEVALGQWLGSVLPGAPETVVKGPRYA